MGGILARDARAAKAEEREAAGGRRNYASESTIGR
jgi:hypothetical protein